MQPAPDRAVEPDPVGPNACCRCFPATRKRPFLKRRRCWPIFAETFDAAYQAGLRAKLGLFTARDGDAALAQDLLGAMAQNQADFTLTFRRLGDAARDAADDSEVRALFTDPAAYDEWAVRWRQRLGEEPQDCDQAAERDAVRSIRPSFRGITGSKP